MNQSRLFKIIMGGQGVYITNPFITKKVSCLGGLGTVSGVATERLLAIILQRGDVGGHYRRALAHFPYPEIAQMILDRYFIEEGNPKGLPLYGVPMFKVNPSRELIALTICANFAFVWLAKEGHENPVSINYLEKIQMPHIYAITGAMLANVDYITMGAGIALGIPKVMRDLADGKEVSYEISVTGTNIKSYTMRFDPEKFFGRELPKMNIPGFIPIIASNLLANIYLKRLPVGSVQGFVIEEPIAGGHNAPPRTRSLNEHNEVVRIYGLDDLVTYQKISDTGIPFWIGGGYASPEKLKQAVAVGATGIQVGTIFALCEESGMDPKIRQRIRQLGFEGRLRIRTDMRFSPTGFPFKVVILEDSLSEEIVYMTRVRKCNKGALVSLYEKPDGAIGYRCAAEPIDDYLRKGGKIEDTVDRGCLCNGLIATTGFGDYLEAPVVTLGDDYSFLHYIMTDAHSSYCAADVFKYLLG